MLHWIRTHAWSHCLALIEATGLSVKCQGVCNSSQRHGRDLIAGPGPSSRDDDSPAKVLCSDRIIAPTASVTTQVQIGAHQGSS